MSSVQPMSHPTLYDSLVTSVRRYAGKDKILQDRRGLSCSAQSVYILRADKLLGIKNISPSFPSRRRERLLLLMRNNLINFENSNSKILSSPSARYANIFVLFALSTCSVFVVLRSGNFAINKICWQDDRVSIFSYCFSRHIKR